MKCPLCSEEIVEGAIKFKYCGEVLNKDGSTKVSIERAKVVKDYSQFKPYYQDGFKQFDQNDGSFIPKWNSPAFLFGFFWYLAKGMWLKGSIMVAITVSFGGVPAIFFWLYCGIVGIFDYYLYASC